MCSYCDSIILLLKFVAYCIIAKAIGSEKRENREDGSGHPSLLLIFFILIIFFPIYSYYGSWWGADNVWLIYKGFF